VSNLSYSAIVLLMVVACRTTTPGASAAVVPAATAFQLVGVRSGSPQPRRSLPGECPAAEVACAAEAAPVICSAGTYQGRELPSGQELVAWGQGVCRGRLNLTKAACDAALKPSELGHIQCVPDAGAGHCPPATGNCPDTGAPIVCQARAYAGQDLKDDQVLRGWGVGDCGARAALAQTACRTNLDPEALQRVSCTPDPTQGECVAQAPAPCTDLLRAATCTAHQALSLTLAVPLTAHGSSICAARQELERLACRQELPPSTLADVTCAFEK